MVKNQIYDIGGMQCAACAAAVEKVTKKMDGVESSEVNLPMHRMTITYDETKVTPETIIAKVERAGFTATLLNEKKQKTKDLDESQKAIKRQRTEIIISVIFAGILLVVSMGHMVGIPYPDFISPHTHPVNIALLELLLTIPVLAFGRRFYIVGFKSLFHGTPNMDTLVALSSTAAFIYSLVTTFMLSDHPELVHSLYYESAAVVVALVAVGKYLEARNQEKTKGAITKLMELAPDTAILVDENGQREVAADTVKIGDILLVKPGARIPLDGVITEGEGSVNEAMLTGESLPVEKGVGSEVIGGSVSVDGAFYIKVTRVGEDTTLSKIVKFVEDAQGKKAPISKIADKVAGVFVPIVMVIAVVSAIGWIIGTKDFSFALKIFTAVLVIACPCAMGLATPTAIIVGTGLGATNGILIRSGEALEKTHKVNVVIFDKTGTITEGKPSVTDLATDDETKLLLAAVSLERLSDHPLSKAIAAEGETRGISPFDVTDFENVTGKGLRGKSTDGRVVVVGNARLMLEDGVIISHMDGEAARIQSEGKTAIYVAEDGVLLGIIGVSDTVKDDAAETISGLKKQGIKTVLLTGDNNAAANYIGKLVGVDEIVAEVLPTEKADVVNGYRGDSNTVMMVGDGINDAPALAASDVGCAIGGGSDIAIDSAEIVLMKSKPSDIVKAIRLSRLTIRNVKQNLFWAFCYNVLGIPIAAGVLYPVTGMLLSPMIGGLAMSLSSLFVVGNALRLRGKKL